MVDLINRLNKQNSLPLNEIFNGFYRNDPFPIFMMASGKPRSSNIATKVTASVPSEVGGRIPVSSGHIEM